MKDRPVLHEVVRSLEAQVDILRQEAPSVASYFAHWLGHDVLDPVVSVQDLASEQKLRQYQDVAMLGFAVESTDGAVAPFREGVEWMAGREFFSPGRPLGFEGDALAILGVAVGLRATNDLPRNWLVDVLAQSRFHLNDTWSATLLAAAEAMLQSGGQVGLGHEMTAVLAARGLVDWPARASGNALKAMQRVDQDLRPEEAAARLSAIRWLLGREAAVNLHTTSLDDVVTVLRSVPHALKRWPWEFKAKTRNSTPQQWDIQNEYHVQTLLWAILAPVFQDLEDEEYLTSLGFKHPRADLVIPSLATVIEVKCLRGGTPGAFSAATGEIAEDTGLYLAKGSPIKSIVAFTWDQTGSNHMHQEFCDGLQRLSGVYAAVVLSRPGSWTGTAASQQVPEL